ncbi:universal stress protein [Novosphingobium tardum]|uniref:Universal stress protein n=1 Tax=Novosphingobium tardum TaxID=1538021 RepID=A0ABV8RN23_9SPHN
MRSILVPADPRPSRDERIESALTVARATNGHVTVQVDVPITRYVSTDAFGGAALMREALEAARQDAEEKAAQISARLSSQDVPFDIEHSDEEAVESLVAGARLADLIVISFDDYCLNEVAVTARCPVLAIPAGHALLRLDQPAVVAWDGGHESANAMRAALPLLRLAESVHVVRVTEKENAFPPSDALCYLSRHDVHAELADCAPAGSIGVTLENAARRLNAGLIVMGAFGHSRLREMILGGVTKHFLTHSKVPLLLAH